MTDTKCLILENASFGYIDEIPVLDFQSFGEGIYQELSNEARVCALYVLPTKEEKKWRLYAVLARDKDASIVVSSTEIGEVYPSLTPSFQAMHLFEREIYEQYNITPQGHPWLKPVRFESKESEVGVTNFFTIDGDEVHEVAVGPIHAGIIECGHFRFQCQGEIVMHLEISLGYHHRGIEDACMGKICNKTLSLMETLAGDTTIGHSWAYCSNIESLAGIEVPAREQLIRAVALELERLANHTGDLGAFANDIGYLPTSSFCGRLRGDYLNLTAVLCGNRFGRNLLTPGGIREEVTPIHCEDLLNKLRIVARDTFGATKLLWDTGSVTARLMGRGILQTQSVKELCMVGPVARACGLQRDVRSTHPLPSFNKHDIALKTFNTGDVYARAVIREMEIKESVEFIKKVLSQDIMCSPSELDNRNLSLTEQPKLAPKAISVSLVEGWRGEICHIAMTNEEGELIKYKVIDPSFHNWIGLALAMRMQQISDFPLCNKSFNLSYCGHDL